MKWITFAESFPLDSKSYFGVLNGLNDDLAQKSVLLGNGLKPSAADIIVFSVLNPLLVRNLTLHLVTFYKQK
jgi:aminoacyl tRNA synthase complex-interacting multifunctional protein 1